MTKNRLTPKSGGGWQYEYNLTDHLGNIRVVFSDTNNDGTPEILQENAYYPFGMNIEELSHSSQLPENKYLYNGKELNDDFGLGWYDYGARWYMPDIGRWGHIDPLAEKHYTYSPYNYALNNPLIFMDPDGRDTSFINNEARQLFNSTYNNITSKITELREKLASTKSEGRSERLSERINSLQEIKKSFIIPR